MSLSEARDPGAELSQRRERGQKEKKRKANTIDIVSERTRERNECHSLSVCAYMYAGEKACRLNGVVIVS